MTKFDADWAVGHEAKRKWLAENGMYSESEEHSSCGVGLVVSVNGKPSRKVVDAGIEALKAVWHRGAVDADGRTGDGAGIHIQIPVPFFYDQVRLGVIGAKNKIGLADHVVVRVEVVASNYYLAGRGRGLSNLKAISVG